MNKLFDFKTIGFDLDGTIYDEYDFISQAYKPVSEIISHRLNQDPTIIYSRLCIEWLHYGSSANIFQNVIGKYSKKEDAQLIAECVACYRSVDFSLALSARSKFIFSLLTELETNLFIVTDGNSNLQRRKIEKLGLYSWFKPENIAISGDYGKEMQKPSPFMAKK